MSTWREVIPPEERAIYGASGYGRTQEWGQRAALIVVDVTYDFVGERPEPIMESVKRFPMSCGEQGWKAVAQIQALLALVRERNLPVFFTKGESTEDGLDLGGWRRKHHRAEGGASREGTLGSQIVREIAPQQGEIVLSKKRPSAFFCSPLVSYLIEAGVDTVLVAGCTTSGCVRATVIDAFSYGFRTFVIEEAVFDRSPLAHQYNLFDMQMKYGDVVTLSDVRLHLPVFQLPKAPQLA